MKAVTSIEPLTEGIPEFEDATVTVNTTYGERAAEIVMGLFETMGRIKEITHYRKRQGANFITYISGANFDVVVKYGLASGYFGSGSASFAKVLKKAGLTDEEIDEVAFGSEDNAVIKIKF